MNQVATRDFRVNPGKVWSALRKSGRIMVTASGKPRAMLVDIEGKDQAEEMRIESIARGVRAVSAMRDHARQTGLDQWSADEIAIEIKNARNFTGRSSWIVHPLIT